jgi:hypothetical protein
MAAGGTGANGATGTTTAGSGNLVQGSGASSTTGASNGSGGTTGSGGSAGMAGSGGGAGTTGSSGAAALDGGTDASLVTDGSPTGGDAAGPATTAGCQNHNYALCIDFENGIDTSVWGTRANANAIETTEVAHGTHAYQLYSDNKATPQGGLLVASKLGTLTSQIWGRFYIHFKPGAPGGHGNLIAAYDGANLTGDWYEMGWQFDGMMGVYHQAGGNERPLRSKPYIVDQWYCIELFFDGTMQNMPRWWIDGSEAQYYMPANTTLTPVLIPQFKTITVGWTPYAGLGLMLPDQTTIIDTRVLNDAWIDDVAFDTQRIGCIQ